VLRGRNADILQQRDALKLERDRLKAKIKEQKATKEAQNKRRSWHWFG
jgi:regulator of replication initiation timing